LRKEKEGKVRKASPQPSPKEKKASPRPSPKEREN